MTAFETASYPVFPYSTGLKLSWGSNTTLTVAAGQALASNGIAPLVTTSTATINAATTGFNGLDTGTFAASTWYYVYMIGDSSGQQPTGFILSASSTTPTLPGIANSASLTGSYDSYRRIGVALTDGSIHFLVFKQVGSGSGRVYYWDSTPQVLSAGTATTLTLVDLSAGVPPLADLPVIFSAQYTPTTANDKVSLATPGSTSTALPSVSGVVAAKVQVGEITQISGLSSSVAKIQYINSAASGSTTLYVSAFTDSI